MKNQALRVLFITAWYPHRYDDMFGLFVRKHAKAASMYCDVKVAYVHADKTISRMEVVEQQTAGVHEIYVYYPYPKGKIINKIRKIINYFKACHKVRQIVLKQNWRPHVIHVNVLTRTGLIAFLYKLITGVPYVITEHWTRYLPQNFNYKGFFRKHITEIVAKNAAIVMPVSEDLKNAMWQNGIKANYRVICNVVDDFFYDSPTSSRKIEAKKRIIHISCFSDKQKNITGILRAVKSLSIQRADFELVLVGTGIDFELIYEYAQKLKLPEDMVVFTGELSPPKVAEWFAKSDFFVMFSNYENAPVVISESLAMGKPVISSDTGGICEMINPENGILIPMLDEQKLSESIDFMLDNLVKYDAEKIKNNAQKYSYQNVGKILFDIYQKTSGHLLNI